MNYNRSQRAALNQALKFYHSSSMEYKQLQSNIEELDRQYHTRDCYTRKLSKDEILFILSTPPYNR